MKKYYRDDRVLLLNGRIVNLNSYMLSQDCTFFFKMGNYNERIPTAEIFHHMSGEQRSILAQDIYEKKSMQNYLKTGAEFSKYFKSPRIKFKFLDINDYKIGENVKDEETIENCLNSVEEFQNAYEFVYAGLRNDFIELQREYKELFPDENKLYYEGVEFEDIESKQVSNRKAKKIKEKIYDKLNKSIANYRKISDALRGYAIFYIELIEKSQRELNELEPGSIDYNWKLQAIEDYQNSFEFLYHQREKMKTLCKEINRFCGNPELEDYAKLGSILKDVQKARDLISTKKPFSQVVFDQYKSLESIREDGKTLDAVLSIMSLDFIKKIFTSNDEYKNFIFQRKQNGDKDSYIQKFIDEENGIVNFSNFFEDVIVKGEDVREILCGLKIECAEIEEMLVEKLLNKQNTLEVFINERNELVFKLEGSTHALVGNKTERDDSKSTATLVPFSLDRSFIFDRVSGKFLRTETEINTAFTEYKNKLTKEELNKKDVTCTADVGKINLKIENRKTGIKIPLFKTNFSLINMKIDDKKTKYSDDYAKLVDDGVEVKNTTEFAIGELKNLIIPSLMKFSKSVEVSDQNSKVEVGKVSVGIKAAPLPITFSVGTGLFNFSMKNKENVFFGVNDISSGRGTTISTKGGFFKALTDDEFSCVSATKNAIEDIQNKNYSELIADAGSFIIGANSLAILGSSAEETISKRAHGNLYKQQSKIGEFIESSLDNTSNPVYLTSYSKKDLKKFTDEMNRDVAGICKSFELDGTDKIEWLNKEIRTFTQKAIDSCGLQKTNNIETFKNENDSKYHVNNETVLNLFMSNEAKLNAIFEAACNGNNYLDREYIEILKTELPKISDTKLHQYIAALNIAQKSSSLKTIAAYYLSQEVNERFSKGTLESRTMEEYIDALSFVEDAKTEISKLTGIEQTPPSHKNDNIDRT